MLKQLKDHILIVDDKKNNIYALEQILSQPGRNLISVTNGNEALKVALNQEMRRRITHALEEYYALHIPDFGTMKTLPVLREVMS